MQGIQAGIQTFETKRREGALPVECDHAGNGCYAEETPILTDAAIRHRSGSLPLPAPRDFLRSQGEVGDRRESFR
ncbi:hypothetical protein GCM10008098_02290 [Rhodanobacter panaciterrae]|uniref:Uncharacterized protein n=1 Tax=Rhodanobacter panaciterrae TaxID=490572 RepID=A0ABQ2ZIA3_9GAMM|nr:hypothetical protein GCM10008098_02290 [Rhodanobacter panaciterrae]